MDEIKSNKLINKFFIIVFIINFIFNSLALTELYEISHIFSDFFLLLGVFLFFTIQIAFFIVYRHSKNHLYQLSICFFILKILLIMLLFFFATKLASFNGERKGIDICDILFALSIFFSFAIPCTIFFFLKSNNS